MWHVILFLSFSSLLCFSIASDVMDLSAGDFDTKLKPLDITLVEFFAPWCGHCKRLAPEYEQAATSLKSTVPSVPLAKVDCTAHADLCSRFGVSGYPTLKIFKNGEFSSEYQGPREADGIVKYMRSKAGPSSNVISNQEEFDKLLQGMEPFVMGFFSSESADSFKAFRTVADQLNEDFTFAHSVTTDFNSKLGYSSDSIVVVSPKILKNKFEETHNKFSGTFSPQDVRQWVESNVYGLVGHRTSGNSKYFSPPYIVAYLDVDYERNPKGTNYWRNRVLKIAKKRRDAGVTMKFAISSSKSLSHELSEFGIDAPDHSKVYVIAKDAKGRKLKMEQEFSMDNLDAFIGDVLAERLEPYLKSEAVPNNDDVALKVAVAKNFDELVNDVNKDVLIEFYAPWCGHCKSLAPKYEELAEKMKNEPELAIVKMDATANDVPQPFEVRGFPTLFFVPKNDKSNPRQYNGGRELNDFVEYLAKESTNPLKGFDRSGKPVKSEL